MAVSLTHAFTTSISDGSTAYTGNFTSGSNQITSVSPTPPASGAAGFILFGGPFAAGTTISSVSGTTITMSANASSTATSATFYSGDNQVQASDWNAQHTLSLAQGNILGRTAAAGTGAATEIPLSFDASNNVTFPGQVNLVAGTTAIAPLDFTAGTNLTTALAGAMEYNGASLFFTPQGTQRGIVPAMQIYQLSAALVGSNVNTAQNILGTANGVALSANTLYAFEGRFNFFKSAGTTSHTFAIGMPFSGTASYISYDAFVQNSDQGYTPRSTARTVLAYTPEVTTSVVMTGAITNAFYTVNITVKGFIAVTAAGNLNPQYTLSAAPGGAYTSSRGNAFMIWPVGAFSAGVNASIGAWS